MLLIDFIKSHKDWEELLSQPPYALKISRDNGYVMFKYNQIESDFGYQLVREARGIILREKDWKVVCRPFDKFFNYGEPNAAEIDWSHVKVTEKIDGSLVKLWWDSEWHWSTNGTIDARKAIANDALKASFYRIITLAIEHHSCLMEEFLSYIEDVEDARSKTFMFEIVSPISRVVIPYDDYDIFYLGARDNETGEYEEYPIFKYMRPREWNFKSIEEVIDAANQLTWMQEGYVVFDGVNRVKVKSPLYVEAHYMRANGAVGVERLIKVVLAHEEDEFLVYCPEYKEKIEEIKTAMYEAKANANWLLRIFETRGKYYTKKNFALDVINEVPRKYQDFMFKWYDSSCTLKWEEYISNWPLSRWEQFIF